MTTWNLEKTQCHLLICNGSSCLRQQGEEVTQAIREEITRLGADAYIHTTRTRCNGRCQDAAVVVAYPEGLWYQQMTPELGRQLVQCQVAGEPMRENLVYSFDGRFIATGIGKTGIDKP